MKSKKQTLLSSDSFANSKNRQFNNDLVDALISDDIPFGKFDKKSKLKAVIEKYTNLNVASPRSMSRDYLPVIYQAKINKMKREIINNKIWISIDETTDMIGRSIANVIIGLLNDTKKCFLFNCQELNKVNHSTIAQLFNETVNLIWPGEEKYENVLVFISDAAPYMIKGYNESLKTLYPKMIHITCSVHAFHRISEKIRLINPKANELISNVKKVFIKAPDRVEIFKKILPEINMSPQPVITRWGTWVQAANYYAINFDAIKTVIDSFDKEAASSIEISQKVLSDKKTKDELLFIYSNYKFLPDAIEKLEASKLDLNKSIEIVTEMISKIENVNSPKGKLVKEKMNYVFNKNSGFKKISKINKILNGEAEMNLDYSVDELASFKYSPIHSCDVERTFSIYKNILNDKRLSFLFENLKMYLITHCNDD